MKRNNRAEMWNIKAILIALSFIGILLMLCIPLTSAKSNCILTIDVIDQQTASVEIDMQLPVNDSTTYKSMVDLFTSEYEEGFKDGLEYLFDSEIVEYIVVHEPSTFYLLFDITLNGNYTSDFTIKEIPVRYTNYLPLDYDKVTVLKESSTITTITNYVFSMEYTIPLNEGVILPSKIAPRQAVTLPIENAEDVSGLNSDSMFCIPDYWVGVGTDSVPPEKEITALEVAEMYRPYFVRKPHIAYPDKVFYRIYKGDDPYTSTTNDAILIMYYGFWCIQNDPPHCNDAEPIYIWVNSIGEKPYKIAYDRWTWKDAHHHYVERNRTGIGATWDIPNAVYDHDEMENVYTQHASYFPQGRRLYNNYRRWGDYFCQVHLEDITNTFDKHHLWLRIGTHWHTYDPMINENDSTSHTSYTLYPLDDETLVDWYTDYACCAVNICEFAYDVSDPFHGLFWEVPNVCEPIFPTISGNIKSAVVYDGILTVKVSMSYDNTGAGGSSGKHLTGLWKDRFDAMISTDTVYVVIGIPKELDEQSPGEYILKYDVSGIDRNSVLILSVLDNVGDLCLLSKDITFVSAEVNIIAPTQSSPASAGDYENPSQKVDVTVNVSKGKDRDPVTGLNNADFTFNIGGKTATASLTDTSIPGRYDFSVSPPHQDAAGKYDLDVSVQYSGSTLEDKEEEALIYTAGGHADVMLIIDRSGSMGGSAIADARNSAKLFVDYMRDDDCAGVVSFASSASYTYSLTPLTAAIKIAIKNAIDGISAGGMTAIGAGLRCGLNDITNLGDPTHAWAMVLLSDGRQNQGEHPNTVLPDIKALDIRVFTIGLGHNVDKALLEHIATETDGEYCYAATSDQLREIYDYIVGKIVGWQTILERKTIIFLNQIIQIFVPIENPAAEAIFSISWGGSDLDLVLYKPDGTKIDPAVAATDPKIEYVEEATYEFYRVTDPDPGEWIMEVTGVDVPPEGEEFTATVKAISPLFMSLTTDKDQYNQGEVIKTIASITEGGLPITGAAVNADITLPYGSTESLTLYDDGGHGDIAANDGVYANYFTNTEQIGNYKIDASATGTTPSGTSFSRQAETTVEVVAGQSVINITQDTWSETVSPGGQVKTTFTVNDPAAIGELFMINEYLHAEYNGTHYNVYNESSIGGEPDYIIPTSPSGKALAASPVSKWVSLTATSLQTPTGDIIDVSNIVLSSDVLEVPLGGSNDFNATINVPHDAPGGIYSGKIVATTIGGSDSVEVEITVISNPPIANANGPYTGVIEYIAVPILFDGTGSYATDPAGTITSYEWDLDNDGEFDDAVGATPTVSYTAPYSGIIHLKVTDNNGATDTDTTTLTITKHSPPPNGIHSGLLTPPKQPQYYCGTSTIQGSGYFAIDERIQDWTTAIDTSEHIEGTGEFAMDSKKVLDQAANTSDFYDPNFYHKKTMQFQGNATNRLLNRETFESSAIFGGTGTRVNEYFDVSMIQKEQSSSIKTISAPGGRQSHSFATMDDFSGLWSTRSQWQKICQKDIQHYQMFKGNFSVQKDLWFEREVGTP